ncbi:hypothetical protein NTGM5_840005 [Candidatus Nitrotoga sp. M5]|nr:hypothetical protein NTGM5_840005 [Candidatus Nitrotoga sp. M5]
MSQVAVEFYLKSYQTIISHILEISLWITNKLNNQPVTNKKYLIVT